MRIALDAMGGDFAPHEAVLGGLQSAEARPDHEILLIGDRAAIEVELDATGSAAPSNLSIVHASQAIGMDEKPVDAIRKKPDSSIVRSMQMVATGDADITISAGNTGAMVAAAMLNLKVLSGVRRPGIAVNLPTATGQCTLIDVGANVNCKPIQLCQYGIMASLYHSAIFQVASPRVGLLNVGEEESKGNTLVRETAALLGQAPIDFVGNVEGRDIFAGLHQVVVCEGFVGNALIKACEGYGESLAEVLRSAIFRDVWGRLSFNLMRPVLLNLQRRVDFAEYGGGQLLGIEGGVIICHGRSNAHAIRTAVLMAISFVRGDVNGAICAALNAGSGEDGSAAEKT